MENHSEHQSIPLAALPNRASSVRSSDCKPNQTDSAIPGSANPQPSKSPQDTTISSPTPRPATVTSCPPSERRTTEAIRSDPFLNGDEATKNRLTKSMERLDTYLNNCWYWEIVCVVLGTACIMAIIVILVVNDGKALSDWTLPIQPNSLVSIFVTVAKSCLVLSISECISQSKWLYFRQDSHPLIQMQEYDEASRGPWGALQLLRSEPRRDWIATIGAALTILSMALDPFAQQIIAYPTRLVEQSEGVANLAATQILDSIENSTMQGAILNGIYLSSLVSSTFICTSPVCFWPQSVVSLGVCSSCRNLTGIVKPMCNTTDGPLVPSEDDAWTFSSTDCSYRINENITFDTHIQNIHFPANNSRPAEYAGQWTQIKVIAPTLDQGLGENILSTTGFIATILAYATYFSEDQLGQPHITSEVLAPEITACGLYWCGQVFTGASVSNGSTRNFDPTATSQIDQHFEESGKLSYLQTDAGRCDVLTVPESNARDFPKDARVFAVSPAHAKRVGLFINSLFNLTQFKGHERFPGFPEQQTGLYGLADAIFRDRDLAPTFERIAASMTEQVRTSTSSYMVPGLAIHEETYVRVRWGWMAFPLITLALSILHLVVTILVNRKVGAPLWKASSIALLFHGVDLQDPTRTEVDAMNRIAKEKTAQLTDNGRTTWQFRAP